MSSSQSTQRRIRIHRINLGESPEAFGARVGLTGMTIRRIEQGKSLTVRSAFLIAADMGMAVIELWPSSSATRSVATA